MLMNKFLYNSIFLMLIFGIFISCIENQQNEDNQDDQNIEDVQESQEDQEVSDSELNNLEDKMDEIMTESEEDKRGNHRDVTIIKANGAKKVEVKLKIGAGKLKLSSGSSELFTGGFIFSDESWKPEINYKVQGQIGYLFIKQPDTDNYNIDNKDKYAWNLKFTENIPLDFNIEVGAGLSEIFLNDLQIEHFSMNMGVGKTEMDLKGRWIKDTEIHLNGGIGLSVIHLPKNVGVILKIEKGLGSVEVDNMIKKSNSEYVNEAFDKSKITLKVYLKTGISKIEVD